jgi:two-component system, OmpR family, KDP operon response regulator KdpE
MISIRPRVLVVDDELSIRRFLHVTLESQEYAVIEAATGQDGLSSASSDSPDIIILDLGLPDIDGIEVLRILRQRTQVPIIILSVRSSDNDKIATLEAGADDYLTKPFSVGELLARLRATLRRKTQPQTEPVVVTGPLKVDLVRRLVTLANDEVHLTPNEYDLLRTLINNSGKVLTHNQILREVWGAAFEKEVHMLQVNISNLRHKIEPDPSRPQFVVAEPGIGYRFKTS